MRKFDVTQKIVLAIGSLALIGGLMALFSLDNPIEQLFPFYIGFTLIGTVLLYRPEKLNVDNRL